MKSISLSLTLITALITSIAFGQTRQLNGSHLKKTTLATKITANTSRGNNSDKGSQEERPKIEFVDGTFFANIEKMRWQKDDVAKKLNFWFTLNDNFSFKQVSEKTDELKITHTNYQQYFKGSLIEGALVLVHSKDGIAKNINGQVIQFSDINTELRISADLAKNIAKDYLNVSDLINEYPVETLIIKTPESSRGIIRLVHKVRIDSATPLTMCHVYIDTQTGDVLNKVNLIAHIDINGTGQTLYSGHKTITCDSYGDSYRLRDNARNIQTYNAANATSIVNYQFAPVTDYVNTSTTWAEGPELDAHWGMEMTLDFYKNIFNRNGYDGSGALIRQYLDPKNYYPYLGGSNNSMAYPHPYNWIEYGMGDGITMGPVVDLTTIGHEFTHKVIEYNGKGGLQYQGETGALNESFADIMGICVDFYAGTNPNWLFGEEPILNMSILRSMSNPNDGQQPDTYKGQLWANTSSQTDNGGVHTNSGVQNFWFYLLCQGGSGTNDLGNAYNVEGIGIEQARGIVYRSLTYYLTYTAKYLDAYYGSLLAAQDLYGNTSPQYAAVKQAWYAVGIGNDPSGFCSGTTNLTAKNGTITDGSNLLDYGNNSNCKWVITPENVSQITLNFTEFDIEANTDVVTVYDGPDENSPVLATLSGNNLPATIQTNTGVGSMCILFTSDSNITKSGWSANYSSTNLGIDDINLNRSISIYPNPTSNLITISYDNPSDSIQEISIYDVTGKKVQNVSGINAQETILNVSHLEKGMYLAEIVSQNQNRAVKKIVIE